MKQSTCYIKIKYKAKKLHVANDNARLTTIIIKSPFMTNFFLMTSFMIKEKVLTQ
jgi:hypothetical protein